MRLPPGASIEQFQSTESTSTPRTGAKGTARAGVLTDSAHLSRKDWSIKTPSVREAMGLEPRSAKLASRALLYAPSSKSNKLPGARPALPALHNPEAEPLLKVALLVDETAQGVRLALTCAPAPVLADRAEVLKPVVMDVVCPSTPALVPEGQQASATKVRVSLEVDEVKQHVRLGL